MTAPQFSVIVPSFNSADSLEDAVRSVVDQSLTDWELIIADDGSTDETFDLATRLQSQDSRIHVIQDPIHDGPGLQRNRGIEAAKGDYLIFLDDDDHYFPGALEALSNRLAQSQPDLLLYGSREDRPSGSRLLHDPETLARLSRRPAFSVAQFPEVLMWPPSCWSRAYRREFVHQTALRFPDGSYSDIRWNLESLLAAQSIEAVDTIAYRYITLGTNTSITTTRSRTSLWRLTQLNRSQEVLRHYDISDVVEEYVVALIAVNLIWANKSAYRTLPQNLHEDFFHDSSAELHWWFEVAKPDKQILSEPLMPTQEREFFSVALLSDSFRLWQQALATHRKKLRWQRRFDLSRYRVFKR